MNRRNTLFTGMTAAVFTLALGAVTSAEASGGVSIEFSSSSSGHARHHRPTYSHGVPFIKRRHLHGSHHPRPHHFRRHQFHGHGRRARNVLGSGCSPATRRDRDRHGRVVIHHFTVCHDRYGRPYVLGGNP